MTLGASPRADDDGGIDVHITDLRAYSTFLLRGTLGAADAYIAGWWTCDDLVGLFRLLTRNSEAMAALDRGVANWLTRAAAWVNSFRRNTVAGSRRNIQAHYDLSNHFFETFLDDTMAYSAGLFSHPGATLQEASRAKFERVCKQLELSPRDRVLEVGSGWGGFAIHAAREYGCRVTTTTISPSQYRYARDAIERAGVADRVDIRLEDYRQLTGRYDKIVSIEMIEAVGHEFLETFFRVCSDLLRPGGAMLLQTITIPEARYDIYRRSVDFIQKHVFPGGNVPSVAALSAAMTRGGDLRIRDRFDFGDHYAETMRHWRERFWANIDRVRQLGFGERFVRMWNYYLCYCESGFLDAEIGVAQLLLVKPDCRLGGTR